MLVSEGVRADAPGTVLSRLDENESGYTYVEENEMVSSDSVLVRLKKGRQYCMG